MVSAIVSLQEARHAGPRAPRVRSKADMCVCVCVCVCVPAGDLGDTF